MYIKHTKDYQGGLLTLTTCDNILIAGGVGHDALMTY